MSCVNMLTVIMVSVTDAYCLYIECPYFILMLIDIMLSVTDA
jgi:hypothetical protein